MVDQAQDQDLVVFDDEAWVDSPAPEPPSRGRLALGLVALATVVVGGATLLYQPPAATVPSVFGMDSEQATDVLEEQGYTVEPRAARACEPRGLALGTEPPTGSTAETGSRVVLRFAVPADVFCMPAYGDRVTAWGLVAFTRGGPAPDFADQVLLATEDGLRMLSRASAADLASWDGALDDVARVGDQPVATTNGLPRLTVLPRPTPNDPCGPRTPAGLDQEFPLRLRFETQLLHSTNDCPLVVDLYQGRQDRIYVVAIAPAG